MLHVCKFFIHGLRQSNIICDCLEVQDLLCRLQKIRHTSGKKIMDAFSLHERLLLVFTVLLTLIGFKITQTVCRCVRTLTLGKTNSIQFEPPVEQRGIATCNPHGGRCNSSVGLTGGRDSLWNLRRLISPWSRMTLEQMEIGIY